MQRVDENTLFVRPIFPIQINNRIGGKGVKKTRTIPPGKGLITPFNVCFTKYIII